jgi:uncharacterized membrane protein
MNTTESPSKAELIDKAGKLLKNGHRFVYIYKDLMAKTNDPDLVNEIIATIKRDQALMEERDAQLNKLNPSKINYTNIIGGSMAILFALLITFVLNTSGFWSTLPLFLGCFGVFAIFRELNHKK